MKKNKPTQIPNTDQVDPDKLKKELEAYLKITEKENKSKQEEEKFTSQLQVNKQQVLRDMRSLADEQKSEELFDSLVKFLNDNITLEIGMTKTKSDVDAKTKENKVISESIVQLEQKLLEMETFNKRLLEKIKEMNTEKTRILTEEEARTLDVQNKCENFKKDVCSKFESNDCDAIKTENENLKTKLEEYKEGTKQIKENLEAQIDLKDKQNLEFQENFKSQIQGKLDELLSQTEKFATENTELKTELNTYVKSYESMSNTINKFNSAFESTKKEYERIAYEIIKLTKENKELKSMDIGELNFQMDSMKKELDELIIGNKEMQEKIKQLKTGGV